MTDDHDYSWDEFDYDRLVAVMYPNGCGGKFIINSLGLSNDALLQDYNLSYQQLVGNLSPTDKLEYLLKRLSIIKNKKHVWDDLKLGCISFFGLDQFDVQRNPASSLNLISLAVKQRKYFFIVTHNEHEEIQVLKRWKNARIIKMYNCYEHFNKGKNHPGFLIDKFNYDHIKWDALWYSSLEKTLNHLEELYQTLGLTDFNKDYITKYYNAWIAACKSIGRL